MFFFAAELGRVEVGVGCFAAELGRVEHEEVCNYSGGEEIDIENVQFAE